MADDNAKDSEPDKPAVSFKTEGDFLAAVAKKTRAAEAKAASAAVADLLAKMGVESVDDIDSIKTKISQSEGAKSEADQLKAALAKLTKQHESVTQQAAELATYRAQSLKTKAILEHSSKVADPEIVAELLSSRLSVGDDGTVAGADGKSVADVLEALLESKPILRAPSYKPGASTSGTAAKAPANNGAHTQSTNGAKPTAAQLRHQLAEQAAAFASGEQVPHP